MCGVVGYTGLRQAPQILIEGLKRLEYRGYDSAGIATTDKLHIDRRRCKGKVQELENLLKTDPLSGFTAIAHTRWATHGRPSDENAHPHIDCSGKIVVVHNGVIENYFTLKSELIGRGHKFNSDTDTEVIAHIIEEKIELSSNLLDAVFEAVKELKGSYAMGVISSESPNEIIAARKNSPLIIGLSDDGNFITSDVCAILPYTKKVIYLDDGEIAEIKPDSVKVYDLNHREVKKSVSLINWDAVTAEKQGYRHFMLKEVFEQPESIQETLNSHLSRDTGNVYLRDFNFDTDYLRSIKKIFMIGCGTAYHACLVGKFIFEDYLMIPCEVDIASEFRYRNPPLSKDTLIIAVSQSGETADTLAAIRLAKSTGASASVICNIMGSSAVREADGALYTHAGPEIGVASTKAFTSQITTIYLLALHLGAIRGTIGKSGAKEISENLFHLPLKIREILTYEQKNIESISRKYFKKRDFLYLGRNINYPIALEGALKLKEISYIHAAGYPAGEMKHGPIALIDEEMPVVVIASDSIVYEKILSNIEEVKARNGIVIAIATRGNEKMREIADDVIYIPRMPEIFTPILNTIPLQLLAYHIAHLRGCDIDQPRNLAKSVTVE
ncbi:glutamine--fructose-6-phosphate transaminase (isomerizing) [Thermodesulfovibrionales bacterium]|nr:glutamine--fructose-6-phosphate transaminase (isomerizing) [Thermodesulfovibrionales bacterium]